jgi:hypothetical protein
MYKRFMGPLAQPVTLLVNNGTDFDAHSNISAHVSRYDEKELVSGGSIEIGDLRLIILAEDIPLSIERMTQKDRIVVEGRQYSVIHWDTNSRSIGADGLAVVATIRGGSNYTP